MGFSSFWHSTGIFYPQYQIFTISDVYGEVMSKTLKNNKMGNIFVVCQNIFVKIGFLHNICFVLWSNKVWLLKSKSGHICRNLFLPPRWNNCHMRWHFLCLQHISNVILLLQRWHICGDSFSNNDQIISIPPIQIWIWKMSEKKSISKVHFFQLTKIVNISDQKNPENQFFDKSNLTV